MSEMQYFSTLCCSTFAVLIAGCSFDYPSGYSFDYQGEQAARAVNMDISAGVTTVNLRNVYGNVIVRASEEEDAAVHWDVTCWADTEEQAARLTKLVKFVSSIKRDTTFNCEVVFPESLVKELRGVKSNITVSIPASMAINVNNSHGDIVATNLASKADLTNSHGMLTAKGLTQDCILKNSHGDVLAEQLASATINNTHGNTVARTVSESIKIESHHGSVAILDVDGHIYAATSHDDIEVNGVGGNTSLKCSHGNIFARHLRGGVVEAETSYGNIDMHTLAKSITCESQHGEVILSAINPDLKKVKVESSFNDIHVTLANGLKPAVTTSASFGEVESEFSENSGGPEVKLHVKYGDITIRRQPNAEQE
jgi:DUF4097 and DUF4098 domain-containing protein YvlB